MVLTAIARVLIVFLQGKIHQGPYPWGWFVLPGSAGTGSGYNLIAGIPVTACLTESAPANEVWEWP
jgi:hypothetical protein